jgi:L-ascorbate metabolism protein UlaG (beta-lactamase superfamily)
MHMPEIHAVEHASFTMKWGDVTIAVDPVGESRRYGYPALILVTDIHHDHCSPETLASLAGLIVAPPAVAEEAKTLAPRMMIVKNEERCDVSGFSITAVPMYNRPDADNFGYHPKGRGNGYIIEKNSVRIYIAGDTAHIPEMHSLGHIDIAFIPMNLPYTMGVEEAAEATIAIAPTVAIPYHYRGPDGLADLAQYERLVALPGRPIRVERLPWYR